MELSLVVAILPTLELDAVEKMLGRIGVRGVTVSKAKGYGAYANIVYGEALRCRALI